jgi:hypothetical protein
MQLAFRDQPHDRRPRHLKNGGCLLRADLLGGVGWLRGLGATNRDPAARQLRRNRVNDLEDGFQRARVQTIAPAMGRPRRFAPRNAASRLPLNTVK